MNISNRLTPSTPWETATPEFVNSQTSHKNPIHIRVKGEPEVRETDCQLFGNLMDLVLADHEIHLGSILEIKKLYGLNKVQLHGPYGNTLPFLRNTLPFSVWGIQHRNEQRTCSCSE